MKKLEIGQIFEMKDYHAYVKIIGIYKPGDYNYSSVKKELDVKTSSTIIKYEKSTSKDFMVGLINYMFQSDFRRNYKLIENDEINKD